MTKFTPNLAEVTKRPIDFKKPLGLGSISRGGLYKGKAYFNFWSSSYPLWSQFRYSGLIWCVIRWTWGSRSSQMESEDQWHMLLEPQPAICSDWGGISPHLGMWTVCRLTGWLGIPLVPLLSSKNLDELPPRIRWFCMRLMRFCFTIFHEAGKDLVITNALSRAPLAKPTSIDESLHSEVEVYLDTHYQPLRNRLQISCVTRKLMKFVNNLFPTVLLHVQAMLIS